MKKFILLIIVLCLFINVFGQSAYPFDVKISGTGKKSILFIPGLSCSGDVWNETVEHYKKDYTCYVLTFHGFAGTKADSSNSYANWEQQIARYIQEKHLQKPAIIGHSIGGGMAMLLASDYPGLISKIVVVDALPCLGAAMNPAFAAEKNPNCAPYVAQFAQLDEQMFYKSQKATIASMMADTVHREQAVQWSVRSDRKTLAEIYCQFLNTDLREKIAAVKCPALVLLEASFAGIKPVVEEQFKNMKTAKLQYSDKALHFIMYDDSKWYFEQTAAFLD